MSERQRFERELAALGVPGIQYERENGSTPDVVAVGQRVAIDLATTSFADKVDKVRWTIPGRAVLGYDGTVNDAKLFELKTADLEKSKISFFWVDAADGRKVRAAIVTKSGAKEEYVKEYNVKGPKLDDFSSEVGVTQQEKRAGLVGMRFGKLTGGDDAKSRKDAKNRKGIRWEWKVTMPASHAGYVKDVQTVLNDRKKAMLLKAGGSDTRTLVWRHPKKTTPHIQLDGFVGTEPGYTAGLHDVKIDAGKSSINIVASDSPHSALEPLMKTISVNDQFTYYIMFKPHITPAYDSIWVPVAKAKWSWKAAAKKRGSQFILSPGKMTPALENANTEFPVYESNADLNEWQQVSP